MLRLMLFPLTEILYFNFPQYVCAVPNMAVVCSSLMYFPCMLLRYFMNDSEMAPVAYIITSIAFVFKLRLRYISI